MAAKATLNNINNSRSILLTIIKTVPAHQQINVTQTDQSQATAWADWQR